MSLTLKNYQIQTLESLQTYFENCQKLGKASTAFYETTEQLWGKGLPYIPVQALPGLPYVCLRLPTGAGKTLVACHSVALTAQRLLYQPHPLVLWLTPSNAIREQTLNALKDRRNPYHQALLHTLGEFQAIEVQEAFTLQKATLASHTTIIVATMQAFRVEDKEGRKVYEAAGTLDHHFKNLEPGLVQALALECYPESSLPKPSLANMLKLNRPLVIVDEAHNARTALSFEMLARFAPSCILEFTATPDRENNPSNILWSVSAAELKAEHMVKLPIHLKTENVWQNLLSQAVAKRDQLEKLAIQETLRTGEVIRPILLIQAQAKSRDPSKSPKTVEMIKDHLLHSLGIEAQQIAIATGDKNEIADLDLEAPSCPIRFILTVQALKEGWNCPWAYVLCSVAETHSAKAAEQLLGRILRLPYAKPKVHQELNEAYAFVCGSFAQVAQTLTDALIDNGFERQEAKDLIVPYTALETPLNFPTEEGPRVHLGVVEVDLEEPPQLETLSSQTAARYFYHPTKQTLSFQGPMKEEELAELQQILTTPKDKQEILKAYHYSQILNKKLSSQKEKKFFAIPVLAYQQGSFLERLEDRHFREVEWQLSQYPVELPDEEYPKESQTGEEGIVDLSFKGEVQYWKILGKESKYKNESLPGKDFQSTMTQEDLVYWLDRHIQHPDVTQEESIVFLDRLISWLIQERQFTLGHLLIDQHRLRHTIEAKIQSYREKSCKENYQQLLFAEEATAQVVVDPRQSFTFPQEEYPYHFIYQGAYRFQKHYYQHIGNLKEDGEEFECAQVLDQHPKVKHWVRNLERQPQHSFWLPTSSDKFYPDFVCELADGRFLVVEYKGGHMVTNDDSKEKQALGKLWAKKSQGRCLFVMVSNREWPKINAILA